MNDASNTTGKGRQGTTAREVVLAALGRIARDLGAPTLSVAVYNKHMRPGVDPAAITVIRRFGSWKAATTAAGLEANPYSKVREVRVNDDEAMEAVAEAAHAFAAHTGAPPMALTQSFYRTWRSERTRHAPAASVLWQRYGLWTHIKWKALGHWTGFIAQTAAPGAADGLLVHLITDPVHRRTACGLTVAESEVAESDEHPVTCRACVEATMTATSPGAIHVNH